MNLVLTLDYELYGDGSGNVFDLMIGPTQHILSICENFNIKITIFFEVIEYLKLKEEWEDGNCMGYKKNPVQAIEKQLQVAVKQGHDVQLHVHPQWINAKYQNNEWKVDWANNRLGDFNTNNNYSVEDLLKDGKRAIESIIQKVDSNYQCKILRAGAYNIVPSKKILEAMEKLNLCADSSVFPGGYENSKLSYYDYKNVSIDKDYWWVDSNDITKESRNKKQIMEIPLFALVQPLWQRYFTWKKIKSLVIKRQGAISSESRAKLHSKSFFEKIEYLFGKEAFTWDYCLFKPSLHKTYFNYIESNLKGDRNSFVLIGHPKSLDNPYLFEEFLNITFNRNYDYNFKTLIELYEDFASNSLK